MIQSDSYQINAPQGVISDFIGTPKNLIEILPQDRIENWQLTEGGCSFNIKGLAHISLMVCSKSESLIEYASASDKPFKFKLSIHLQPGEQSTAQATFDLEVNTFMATMIKSPMANFLNHLGKSIQAKYEEV